MRGLRAITVICWRFLWRWGQAGQHRISDRLSGSGAFFLFCFRKTWRTSSLLIWIAGVGERGVAGGVNGCVERCSGQVGCFFKPAIELIQIVCQLLILHSAGGWCLVVGYLFYTDFESLEENWILSLSKYFLFATLISFSSVYLACLYKTLSPFLLASLAWRSCLSFVVNHGLSLL